jgi:hypothetical protein
MRPKPSDQAAHRLRRAAYQNGVLIILATAAAYGCRLYPDGQIELWVLAGLLLAAAVANLVRVVRINRRSVLEQQNN